MPGSYHCKANQFIEALESPFHDDESVELTDIQKMLCFESGHRDVKQGLVSNKRHDIPKRNLIL
jgi:hypothetical protein